MSKSPKVPTPPGLSPQELDLLNQQKLSLEQFSKLLTDESLKATETQNILKGISGLYKSIDIPESRGTERRETVADIDKFNAARSLGQKARETYLAAQRARRPISEIDAIQSLRGQLPDQYIDKVIQSTRQLTPAIRRLSPEDRIVRAFSDTLSGASDDRRKMELGFVRENVLPGEVTPGRTELQLDQEAVKGLRDRIQQNLQYQESLAARDREIEEKAGSILDQLMNRQQMALEGKLPIDPAIAESKKREFVGVAENLRRRGYDVIGDDPDTAVAIGTPAVQTLDTFKKRYNLIEDASRRGELDAATSRNLGQFGLVQELRGSSTANPALTSLNFLSSAAEHGPARFMGAYPSLTAAYGALQSPYANQRQMQYGADVQNSALSSQRQGGLLNLASTLATTGLLMKAPWLAGAGAGFGLMGLMSTKKAKKNIHRLTKREENKVFDLVRKGNVYTFDYKDPRHGEGKRIGIIAEEAPKEFVTPDRKAQDVGNTLNILLTSIRALDRKIDRKFRLTRRAA